MLRPTPTTVEPLRVSPPEAVAYQFELTRRNHRANPSATVVTPPSKGHYASDPVPQAPVQRRRESLVDPLWHPAAAKLCNQCVHVLVDQDTLELPGVLELTLGRDPDLTVI